MTFQELIHAPFSFATTPEVTIYKAVWSMAYDADAGWHDKVTWVKWRYYPNYDTLKDQFTHGYYAKYVQNHIHEVHFDSTGRLDIYLEMPKNRDGKDRAKNLIKAIKNFM